MKNIILLVVVVAFIISPTPHPPMFGVYVSPPSEIVTLNAQLTTGRAVIGVEFIDVATLNIRGRLQQFTDMGVVPFINIMVGNLPKQCQDLFAINSGDCDAVINHFVNEFIAWGGRAYIVPFPEANGGWASYGLQPDQYKAAYSRIRSAFIDRGVTQTHALFVFAPNAWSEYGHEFEMYYPGSQEVDVVGLSFFSGSCSGGDYTTSDLYKNYLIRVRKMAGDKPVFLTQFGADTNQTEFISTFLPFLREWGIAGVLWFNGQDGPCDYRIKNIGTLDAALYGYTTQPDWNKIFVAQRSQQFCRVIKGRTICLDISR